MKQSFELKPKPVVGQFCIVRKIQCRIIAIECYGTILVEALDGSYRFRLSGLGWKVK